MKWTPCALWKTYVSQFLESLLMSFLCGKMAFDVWNFGKLMLYGFNLLQLQNFPVPGFLPGRARILVPTEGRDVSECHVSPVSPVSLVSPVWGRMVPHPERKILGTTWADYLLRLSRGGLHGDDRFERSTTLQLSSSPLPFFQKHWKADHLKPIRIWSNAWICNMGIVRFSNFLLCLQFCRQKEWRNIARYRIYETSPASKEIIDDIRSTGILWAKVKNLQADALPNRWW